MTTAHMTGTEKGIRVKAWNAKTRRIIQASFSYTCATCGLESDWSHNEKVPAYARMEIGHIKAVVLGGNNRAENLIGQCFCCNRDANDAGIHDLTMDVIQALTITAFIPGPLALEREKRYGKIRDRAPVAAKYATIEERREARRERGLVW